MERNDNIQITYEYGTGEKESFWIPFGLIENEYYMCYVKGSNSPGWDDARIVVLKFSGIQHMHGRMQPVYTVVDDKTYPGPGMVVPFKALGCQWPPHPGEDTWT